MDIKKKYKKRSLVNGILIAILFVIYTTIVENNPTHKWFYIVAGGIVFAFVEEILKKALKIDELRYYMNKEN